MASDKFGANPVAPLYNATGRNPRDITPTSTGQPLGSVGSSGAGGYDYGISNRPPEQVKGIANDIANFFDPYNPYGPNSPQNRRQARRQSQSQPQGGGQPQGMSQTSSTSDDGTTQTNTLNNPNGAPISFNPSMIGTDNSVQKGAYSAGPMTAEKINTGNSGEIGDETNQKSTVTVYENGPLSKNTTPRAPRTDAQKAQRNAADRARRAQNKVNPPAEKQTKAKPAAQRTSGSKRNINVVQSAPGGNF